MKPTQSFLTPAFAVGLILVAPLASLQAQPTAPAAQSPGSTDSSDPSTSPTVELSPFVVNASGDVGYLATSTLAGSRLNMPLRDVGASITAITKEFLQDTNSTNLTELLVYTVNTESGGLDGNALGSAVATNGYADEAEVRRNPQNATRVRALAAADRSRNYFTTAMPGDHYNVDRVDISRGANALLFGLGSPAGVINNTLITARTDKNFGEATVGVGDEGSFRLTADYNQVLVEDRLAVRLALLENQRKYRQEPAHNDDRRAFFTITSKLLNKPETNLSLNASYERGRIDAIRPRRTGPGDRVNIWLWGNSFPHLPTEGRGPRFPDNFLSPDNPRYQPPSALFAGRLPTNLDIPTDFFDVTRQPGWHHFANSFRHMSVIFEQDGSAPGVDGTNIQGLQTQRLAGWVNAQGIANGNAAVEQNFMTMWYINQYSTQTAQLTSFPLDVYDFSRNLLGGTSEVADSDFDATDISLQGNFFRNRVGFELAYSKSKFEDTFASPISSAPGYNINVDPNLFLTDGVTPNPNFGRLFATAYTDRDDGLDEQESTRLTAYAAFDASKRWNNWFGRILGSHRVSGLLSVYDRTQDNLTSNLAWAGETAALAVDRPAADHQERQVRQFVYFGPSVAGERPNEFRIEPNFTWNQPQGGETFKVRHWSRSAQNWVTSDLPTQRVYNNGTELRGLDVDSKALVLQSNWLDDSIVTIVGWREDEAKSFSSRNAPPPGWVVTEANDGIVNVQWDESVAPGELTRHLGQQIKGDIWSYSAVAHISDWVRLPWGLQLSGHFSKSENFQTLAGDVDMFGRFLAPPGGASKDWGLTLSTKDNRASLRLNFYRSDIKNSRTTSLSAAAINGAYVLDFQTLQQWYEGLETGWVTLDDIAFFEQGIPQSAKDLVGYTVSRGPSGEYFTTYANPTVRDTEDLAGKGMEIEGTFNITPNWRVHANVAQTRAKSSNIAPAFREYVDLRRPVWGDVRDGTTSRTSAKPRSTVGLPNINDTANPNYPDPNQFGDTTAISAYGRAYTHYDSIQRNEGRDSDRIREWRFNFVTNYQFREGRLRGFGVGGAYRWEDEAVVSYANKQLIINEGTPFEQTVSVADFERPFVSEAESNVDLWVSHRRKIFSDRIDWHIQLNVRNVTADSDGLIPIAYTPTGVPTNFITKPTRTWWLTSSFKF